MNPAASPSATPVPIEDIVPPIAYFPYPWWWVAIAVVVLFALLAGLVWLLFFRKKKQRPLTAREEALQKLETMRAELQGADVYAFGTSVSDVLRRFIEKQYGLAATKQTSLEFLNSIRTKSVFKDEEKAALALFLEKADLIKFAHTYASERDGESLLETALLLVKEGEEVKAS